MKSSEHVRGAAEGFSLLELMIAISILGLVVVLLSDGVQFAGAVWKSQNRAHLELDDQLVGRDVFRRFVAQALPLSAGQRRLVRSPVAFDGEARRLRFVSPPPDHVKDGALRLIEFRIDATATATGSRLLLRIRPLQPDLSDFESEADVHESLLNAGFSDARFSYFRVYTNEPGGEWLAEWRQQERLPNLVRLSFEGEAGHLLLPNDVLAKIPVIERE